VLVVDASCLYEVLSEGTHASDIRQRLLDDREHTAPHVIDAEVFGLIRRDHLRGVLDETLAGLAVEDLRSWPGERFGCQPMLARAWELRHTVRGWDAMYVTLAELIGAPLLTMDRRLARAVGPRCSFDVIRTA
jgi:predicted nucleic acid-binding protein